MPTISSISSTRGGGTPKVILHYKKLFFYVDKYSISYISDDPDNCKVGRLDCTMTCTRDSLTLRWQLGRILSQTNLFILHCFHILNLMIICHLKNKNPDAYQNTQYSLGKHIILQVETSIRIATTQLVVDHLLKTSPTQCQLS